MKIISLLWGYSLGGIGKVALTYGRLEEVSDVSVRTIVVQPQSVEADLTPLDSIDSGLVLIKNRFDFSWIQKLKNEIENYNPDALFVHGFNGPIIGVIQKTLYFKGLPLVCSYHGSYHASNKLRLLLKPIFNYLPVLVYKYAACKVITVENYSKKILISKGVPINKMEVAYNGIPKEVLQDNLDLSEWGLNEDDFIIGCASRINPIKGIIFLIEAFYGLQNKFGHKLKLVIIGEGTAKNELEKQVNELGLSESVVFTSYQNNIPDWLQIFDVFALPSILESHSIGLLEAMRAKKAIVATNVGGNPESIRHLQEGLLVDSKSSDQLYDAISQLYNDKALALELGKNACKRFNNNFSEKATMNNLVVIFKNILNK
tara:strand:+ start:481 stop:1599 length:1119 start_codon:yes stop_codon:yes gene_type:complete